MLNILFTFSGLNKTLMSLVNCFILPPKHPITRGTTMTLYCSRLLRNSNANCWYFWSFWSSCHRCLTQTDTPYRLSKSSSLIRLLTSGRVSLLCSLSSSDASGPRGVYICSSGSVFLLSSFHSITLCLVEVCHCWLPIRLPTPSVHCCAVERTLCWLIFCNQPESVAPFPVVFSTTDIDHYHLVLSSSSMPSFQPFIPACWTQLQS